jgi:hypothetical protein
MSEGDVSGNNSKAGRTSPSAQAARKAELARIVAMSPLERMALALSLGHRRLELAQRRQQATALP